MPESRSPLLFILSGPSGVGKDTVIRRLRGRFTDMYFAVTATTRPRRPGEVPDKDYYFVSREEYNRLLDGGELLVPAQVHGNWYGAPLEPIRQAMRAGKDVFLKIDVQGAIQMRRRLPQAIFIFLSPPSEDDLLQRLTARHTESHAELRRRLKDARFELAQLPQYDYAIVNRDDDILYAVDGVACIISAERLRTNRQPIVLEKR